MQRNSADPFTGEKLNVAPFPYGPMPMSFNKKGVVSIWVGQTPAKSGSDFLRDGFGIEDYDLDFQDCIVADCVSPIRDLSARLSYSNSFLEPLLQRASGLGITSGLWVLAQYDFDYDPNRSGVKVPVEPAFIGSFSWHDES
jgi:hypothetical protein